MPWNKVRQHFVFILCMKMGRFDQEVVNIWNYHGGTVSLTHALHWTTVGQVIPQNCQSLLSSPHDIIKGVYETLTPF